MNTSTYRITGFALALFLALTAMFGVAFAQSPEEVIPVTETTPSEETVVEEPSFFDVVVDALTGTTETPSEEASTTEASDTVSTENTESTQEETTTGDIAPVTTPTLSTEKDDYHPGETATIFGRFFAPLQNFMVKVFGSDDNNQNYTETTETVATDESGSFTLNYVLDSLYRPFYEVAVSTLSGEKIAETWFRDAAVSAYNQCSNDDGDGYATGDTGCRFINGALNSSNSTYTEGDSTLQRLVLDGFAPNSVHTVTLRYGTTKQGKHAYDFLTTWSHSENWATLADRCDGLAGCTTASETTLAIPNDTNGSGQFQGTVGARNFVMRGATLNSATTPVLSGSYAGDSETDITITFTVGPSNGPMCDTKGQVTSCAAILWFGAHIAKSADWTPFNGTTGAGTINGSPYHVAVTALDGSSIGNRDNQMQANNILPPAATGVLTIIKDALPNDAQDFGFSITGTGTAFSLDDDADGTLSNTRSFSNLVDGTYTVTEGATTGWDLTNLVCADLTGSTTVNVNTRTATIGLSGGETVTCTYTNTKRGSITIVKNTVGGNGTFNFTGNTGVTQLVTSNGTAQQTVSNVAPGTYNIAETAQAGWTQTSATCDSGETIDSIDVGAGENVTCTFTNTKDATLTLQKTVTNDNGGTAVANDFQAKIDDNNVAWNTPVTVSAGAHTASETNLAGYTASAWGTDCAANGTITLAAGENKICTITNNDNAPSLTLNKIVVNDNGGNAAESAWTLTANGGNAGTLSGAGAAGSADVVSGATFKAGTYALSESTGPTGYSASSWSCTGTGTQNGANITLALGQSAVCTITNNDVAPQLTVIKHVVNDNGGTAAAGEFTMNVTGTDVSDASFPGAENPGTTVTLDAGAYSVDESNFSGYAKTIGADCSGTIAVGESKTCTITNDDIAPKLHLRKVVINDNGGSASTTDFTLTANGTGANDISGISPVDSGASLQADTFTLSEVAGVTGYTASAWSCGDVENVNNTVTLGIGQETTCTITNDDQPGTLIVKKVVDNGNTGATTGPTAFGFKVNDGTTVSFDADGQIEQTVDAGTYSVTEPAVAGYTTSYDNCSNLQIPNGGSATCTITNTAIAPKLILGKIVINDNGGTATKTDFQAKIDGNNVPWSLQQTVTIGAHTASETNLPGYAASAWGGDCAADGSMTLSLGETKTCFITNNDIAPTLKLVKVVANKVWNGDNVPGDWTLTASGTGGFSDLGDSTTFHTVKADTTYVLSESTVAGYQAGTWSCDGGSIEGNNLTLALDEDVTCSITNTAQPAKITLIKEVVNNNGGTAQPDDFNLTIGGGAALSGVTMDVQANTPIALNETQVEGYAFVDITGDAKCPAILGGTVTLNEGESITCTIKNDDIAPKLHLRKVVKNDNGGSASTTDFTLTANGTGANDISGISPVDSGTGLLADTFTLSETNVPGYEASDWSCGGVENVGDQITLDIGQEATCTITNDDQQAYITVTKVVENNHGGDAEPNDFKLTIDDGETLSGVKVPVNPGTYTIGETLLSGYQFVSMTGECVGDANNTLRNAQIADWQEKKDALQNAIDNNPGDPDNEAKQDQIEDISDKIAALQATIAGSMTVALGEDKQCTITNSDIAPELTVVKHVINDNGGTLEADAFTMNVDADNVAPNASFEGDESGTTVTLDAGAYTVDEDSVPGYAKTLGVNCEGTIALGQHKTCVVTNDDIAPKLTLNKEMKIDNNGNEDEADWTLTATGPTTISGPGAVGITDVVSGAAFKAGEYALSEDGPAGYSASAWECVGGTQDESSVTLGVGEEATCTITNDDEPAGITLIKKVVNDYGTPADPDAFNLSIGAIEAISGQEEAVDANTPYALNEGNVTGYTFTSIGEGQGDSEKCPAKLGESVTLNEGEHITCTIVNTAIAPKLTVIKKVINDNGGTLGADAFTMQVTAKNPSDDSFSGSTTGTTITLDEGAYSVSEGDIPTGYSQDESEGECDGDIAIGEHKICTIVNNDEAPTLTLVKEVKNDNGGTALPTAWMLSANGPTPISGAGGTTSDDMFDAGEYDLSESTGPSGYAASAWSCEGGTQDGASITLGLGQNATCTIVNDDIAPKLHLRKVVTNDNGGTATVLDFTLKADGTDDNDLSGTSPVDSGAGLQADTFTLSEVAGVTGYTASKWSCGDVENVNNTVTLGIGQETTCTITNDDQPGHLIVNKVTVPGTDTTTEFSITATGGTVVSPAATQSIVGGASVDYTVNKGTYSVSEAAKAGWDMTGNTCSDIAVGNGETKECTITNTKRGKLIVDKVTIPGGNTTEFAILAAGNVAIPGGGAGTVTDATNKEYEVKPGTYSVTETVPTGWDQTSNTCTDVVVAAGETKTCTITNTKRGTVTVVKDALPNDTQDFAFTSVALGSFTLDDDAGVQDPAPGEELNEWNNTKTVNNVVPGSVTVTETQPNQYWKLKGASCALTGTATVVTANVVGGALTFTLAPGADVTCTFVNEKLSPTRTQGFWQTHTAYTSSVFAAKFGTSTMSIGSPLKRVIDSASKLFGAWYSSIPKTTTNQQRSALDKARMTLLQQLVTAKLNCAQFGCSQTVKDMIALADQRYTTGTTAQILTSSAALDAFNNSGDSIIIGGAPGKATPKDSQSLADKIFWNVTGI